MPRLSSLAPTIASTLTSTLAGLNTANAAGQNVTTLQNGINSATGTVQANQAANNTAIGNAQTANTAAITGTTGTTNANTAAIQALLQQIYGSQTASYQPYAATGAPAAASLTAANAPGGSLATPFSYSLQDFQNDPSYQFRLQQGQQALLNQEAAGGSLDSGGAVKAMQNYTQGEATQSFNQDEQQALSVDQANKQQQLQSLMDQIGVGQYGTTGQAAAGTQLGNASSAANTAQNQNLTALTGQQVNSTTNLTGQQVNSNNLSSQDIAQLQLAASQAAASGNTAQANAINGIITGATSAATAGLKSLASAAPSAASVAAPAVAAGSPAALAATPLSASALNPSTASAISAVTNPGVVPGPIAAGTDAAAAGGDAAAAGGAAATGAAEGGAAAAGAGADGEGVAAGDLAADGVTAATVPGGSILSAVTGFLASNPWTIGVAGAILGGLAILQATQVHQTANDWTQKTQTQFGNNLTQAVQSFNQNLPNMTQQQAQQAVAGIKQLTDGYQAASTAFAQKGSKQQTVINQSNAEMTKDFGANFSTLLGDLNAQVQGMGA